MVPPREISELGAPAPGAHADARGVKVTHPPAMSAGWRPDRGLRPARERPPTLREAADAFLAQPDLAASSYRSYAQTLGRLGRDLGPGRPLEWVCGRELERAVVQAWGGCAPATWNRHVATVRSFSAYCVRRGWVGEPFDESRRGRPRRVPNPDQRDRPPGRTTTRR